MIGQRKQDEKPNSSILNAKIILFEKSIVKILVLHNLFLMWIELVAVSINSTFHCLHIMQEFMVYMLCAAKKI